MKNDALAFLTADEVALGEKFIADGHLILPVEDVGALDHVRSYVAGLSAARLGESQPDDNGVFLNTIHEKVPPGSLNDFRLALFEGMNAETWFRLAYFALLRSAIISVVGNELAMQRRVNLSIQLPGDDSSLLPVHADVWSGDSPFEVVLWVPLVDCSATKSMYLLPPRANAKVAARLHVFRDKSAEDLFRTIEPDIVWLDVPYGSCVLFSQNLMHGNRVNQEVETRWSLNCRFKGALTPYADKKLGEFFEPITLRAATRMGAAYKLPEGFDE